MAASVRSVECHVLLTRDCTGECLCPKGPRRVDGFPRPKPVGVVETITWAGHADRNAILFVFKRSNGDPASLLSHCICHRGPDQSTDLNPGPVPSETRLRLSSLRGTRR